jgi:hypothetical protein
MSVDVEDHSVGMFQAQLDSVDCLPHTCMKCLRSGCAPNFENISELPSLILFVNTQNTASFLHLLKHNLFLATATTLNIMVFSCIEYECVTTLNVVDYVLKLSLEFLAQFSQNKLSTYIF